jgi:hypothetical protein
MWTWRGLEWERDVMLDGLLEEGLVLICICKLNRQQNNLHSYACHKVSFRLCNIVSPSLHVSYLHIIVPSYESSSYLLAGPNMEPLCRAWNSRGNIVIDGAVLLAQLGSFHIVESPEEVAKGNIHFRICKTFEY